MATSNVVNKNTAAFIDFEFVVYNHKHITQDIVLKAITNGMINRLSQINETFNPKELKISEFSKKANKRRVNGWVKCLEGNRHHFITAFQQIMTDKTVSKIISIESKVKSSKIKIGQLMLKFSNDFDVEMSSFDNTESIPDKYLQTQSFRNKSVKQFEDLISKQYTNEFNDIISQLKTFGYCPDEIKNAINNVNDNKNINSIISYIDDSKESISHLTDIQSNESNITINNESKN